MIETKNCCVKAQDQTWRLKKIQNVGWWVGLICCILTNRAKWGPNSTQADELMMIVMKLRHDFPRAFYTFR